MKSILAVLGLAGFICIGPVRGSQVVYSTLGSSAPDYNASQGLLITGASLPPGYGGLAVPFVPSGNYEISFMDFALIYFSGTNSALVELTGDASGMPGAVLGSWTVSGVPNAYALAGLPVSVSVTAGLQYWVAIQPEASDTVLAWAYNTQGISSEYGATKDGTTYSIATYTLPAFDILGSPVPEPSTFMLGIAAAALLAGRVWRKRLS